MSKPILRVTHDANLAEARKFRDTLAKWCLEQGVSGKSANNMLLVVSEVVANVVKHGNPKADAISMQVCQDECGWRVEIEDNGGFFREFDEKMNSASGELAAMESGMGLGLVHKLTENYEYAPIASGNRLSLLFGDTNVVSKPRVAIVDDEKVLRELLAHYLADDYQVDVYADGSAALKGLVEVPADLVISDISMPHLDGISLRRALERHPALARTPFVFLTSDEMDDTQSQAARLGVDDYLVKPINKKQLTTVVCRVLNKAQHIKRVLGDRLDHAISAALRPQLPERLAGFRVAVGARTAGAGGGDFIHYHSYDDCGLLVLGDIMGHGEQAKFFAHVYAGYLRGLLTSAHDERNPARLLDRLANTAQTDLLMQTTLLTCIALTLQGNELKLASAAHPQAWLCDRYNIQEVGAGGPLLSLALGDAYSEETLTLEVGQRLFIYTDGFFDAITNREEQGAHTANIKQILMRGGERDFSAVAQELQNSFDAACESSPRDDATFILLERN